MIKKILVFVVVLIAGVLAYAATRPDSIHVERSIIVTAPPEKIFALINDFHRWVEWSPYDKKDLAMKKTYSGSTSGRGAVYEWDGNSSVGQGRMEITDTAGPSHVVVKLDFMKPFEGHDVAEFTMTPRGESTTITWTMDGKSPYVAKLMGVFLNMDKMIGGDFETGLGNLKAIVEK